MLSIVALDETLGHVAKVNIVECQYLLNCFDIKGSTGFIYSLFLLKWKEVVRILVLANKRHLVVRVSILWFCVVWLLQPYLSVYVNM